jgi:hypothetical protein
MYRIFFLTFFLTLILTKPSFGQNKIDLSLSYSPLYSYRSISNSNDLWSFIVDELNGKEQSILSHKIEASADLNFNKKYLLQLGLGYKIIGHKIILESRKLNDLYDPETIIIEPKMITIIEEAFYEKYSYISFSPTINRKFQISEKIEIALNLGASIDYLFSKEILRWEPWNYGSFALSANVGTTILYSISDKFHVFVKPIYSRYLTPNATLEYDDEYWNYGEDFDFKFKQYNYQFGLEFGLKYTLKNKTVANN